METLFLFSTRICFGTVKCSSRFRGAEATYVAAAVSAMRGAAGLRPAVERKCGMNGVPAKHNCARFGTYSESQKLTRYTLVAGPEKPTSRLLNSFSKSVFGILFLWPAEPAEAGWHRRFCKIPNTL
ncbi:hypothetical protein ACFPAF_02970 [Hymenobacter endophyticus]|uniref:Uncharacterized protein n=1 Tax=Hymenobacter endophyticus TaxID=3076335 RepID=A0ABU3TD96_9BACT|nr:hypothetical protein [Hymenobacter endophyticus]MDU0369346.1 hypothetical protein [Hymenobacter endophyticus]